MRNERERPRRKRFTVIYKKRELGAHQRWKLTYGIKCKISASYSSSHSKYLLSLRLTRVRDAIGYCGIIQYLEKVYSGL